MTVSDIWDHEIGSYLINGAPGAFGVESVQGWLNANPRPRDHDLAMADGIRATTETQGARVITLELYYEPEAGDGAAEAFEAAADLLAAWQSPDADVALHAMLPGSDYGHVYVMGRCRPLEFDPFDVATNSAVMTATATFVATDPTVRPYVAP